MKNGTTVYATFALVIGLLLLNLPRRPHHRARREANVSLPAGTTKSKFVSATQEK